MYIRRIPFLFLFVLILNACSDGKTYQVGIVKPMMVVNVTPGGADDVPLDSEITVQFSDPVVEGSLTPETILLAGPDAAAVEAVFTYDGAENKLTMKPAAPFAYSAVYTLTITKKIKRKADKAVLAKEIVHTFRTIDPPNLTIVESAPSGNATSIGAYVNVDGDLTPYGEKVSTTVVIHFSEGLDKESVTAANFTLKDSGGVAVAGVFTWESTNKETKDLLGNLIASDDILTFTPDAPLKLSTVYTITLKGTFKGIISKRATESGGWFAEDVVWTFRTIDPPPLGLVSSMPSPNAVNMGPIVHFAAGVTTTGGEAAVYGNFVSHNVVLSFTESVNTASFAANVTLVIADEFGVPSTTGVAGVWQFSSSDTMSTEPWKISDTATFIPSSHWSLSGNYAVVIKKTLESYRATAVSGSIERDIKIAWETAHPLPLQLISNTPTDGATNVGTLVYRNGGTLITTGSADQFGNRSSHTVVLQFSEAVDAALFNSQVGVFVADETGIPSVTPVAGNWVPTNSAGTDPWRDGDTWTFTPATEWSLSGNYAVVISAPLASYRATTEGGQLGTSYNIDWEEAHPASFGLISNTPTDGATNVGTLVYRNGATLITGGGADQFGNAATHTVVLRFSEAVSPAQFATEVGVFVADESGNPTVTTVAGIWAPSNSLGTDPWADGDTWTFTPANEWALSGNYAVVVSAALTSYRATAEQGTLGITYTIDWEEAHPEPLRILSVTPSDGTFNLGQVSAAGYGPNATHVVEIRFSESINAADMAGITLTDQATLAVTAPFAPFDSGVQPWQQGDVLRFVLNEALSKNFTLTLPAATRSYRSTAEAGTLGTASIIDWDLSDPLPLMVNDNFPGTGSQLSDALITDTPSTDMGDQIESAFAVKLYFSEAIDQTLFESSLTVKENTVDVTVLATFTYDLAMTAVTIDLPTWELSSVYEISMLGGSIATGAASGVVSARGAAVAAWYNYVNLVDTADDTGGFLSGDRTLWFTTPDPDMLTITSITPSVDTSIAADNIARGSSIVVTFSEAVSAGVISAIVSDGPANIYARLTTGAATTVPAAYTFNGAGTVLTIDPVGDLDFSTEHELAILGGSTGIASWRVTSVSGWLVPTGTTVHKFKTIDPATLVIWATSPSDNDAFFGISVSDVAVDSDIQILFDQPVDSASFEAAFSMKDCGSSATNCATGVIVTPVAFTYPNAGQKAVVDVGPLQFDRWYEITILGGATGVVTSEFLTSCSATCEGGYLPSNYVITFGTRSTPPLEVDLVEPSFTTGVGIRPRINVEFSTAVSLSTLTGFSYYITDETNSVLLQRYQDNAADYAVGATAEIVLLADLNFATRYSIVLQSSVQGTDGRFLGREVRLGFTTKLASLVISTDPADLESAIETNLSQRDNAGGITVVFDGAVTTDTGLGITPEMALTVTYETAMGVAVLMGTVDTSTPGLWVFVPDPTCTPGSDPLIFNTDYFINLTDDIWRFDGTEQLTGGYKSVFSTGGFPQIASIDAVSSVPGTVDLTIDMLGDTDSLGGDANEDVPVGATITIGFSRMMNTATIVATDPSAPASDTLLVQRVSDNVYMDLKNLVITGTSVSFNVDDTASNVVADDMNFATQYRIVLRSSVRDNLGNPLNADFEHIFKTSPAPTATLVWRTGDTTGKKWGHASSAVFSVPVAISSLTDTNFYIEEGNAGCTGAPTYAKMPALIALGYDARSAAVFPTPYMASAVCHIFQLVSGATGPRDSRGNPFPVGATRTFDSETSDNATSTIQLVPASSIPLANAINVTGRQLIRARLAVANDDATVLPTSLKPTSFWVYSDAARAVEVPGRVYFDVSTLDAVFEIETGNYFQQGQTYYVKTNKYITSSRRHECTTCVNYQFQVESNVPTVSMFTPLNAAGNVAPDATVSITFSESIRPETAINGLANLSVLDGGVPLSGTWSLGTNDTVATFTPSQPFTGGANLTTTVGAGVLDYAGNGYVAGQTATFTVTTVAPTVLSSVPAAGATGVAIATDLTITFDKNVAPASFTTSLWGGGTTVLPGSIRMNATSLSGDLLLTNNAASEVWACVYTNDNVVTYVPLDLLGLNTQYWWGLSTGITDLGGNALAAPYAQSFTTTP